MYVLYFRIFNKIPLLRPIIFLLFLKNTFLNIKYMIYSFVLLLILLLNYFKLKHELDILNHFCSIWKKLVSHLSIYLPTFMCTTYCGIINLWLVFLFIIKSTL